MKLKIGCIGQGFVGKNYADDLESRDFTVVRYSQEPEYIRNREEIASCDIVLIAVPTPTTTKGFDSSIVESVLSLVGKGRVALIKSTMLPGTTRDLAEKFPDIYVMHSPEFLREKTAAHDVQHPERNIIGIPNNAPEWSLRAEQVLSIFRPAPFSKIMDAESAELIKYMSNCFLMSKVVFFNIMYDIANELCLDWDQIKESVAADSRIGASHTEIIHRSDHDDESRRGAGGRCFVKDFAAMRELHEKILPENLHSLNVLKSIERNNIDLLRRSGKDVDIINDIYKEN